ncbi:hypothetical protein SAMN05421505_11044 [Sinosporangium album]|uniref:DUF917 domain-containing protein n=1 Tax=Sinosporangium album TaxID=504805 RepID=A0A1G7YRX0_9ACTN|nr:DUF917 domain-containing protein [Sinosporangium album]SDG99332.1 hypothetical protein SAMN05421505_11044 [Sinosporangium album]
MRLIDETALADIALGSTVLGSGGGGDPYVGMLLAREAIRRHGPVPLVDVDEVPDDANIVFIAGLGAPGVLVEKLPRENEYAGVLGELERFTGKTYSYVCPAEAGGFNGITPFATAAVTGVPVIDADGMGRAFPELQLVTPTLYGGRSTPLAMLDEHGNAMYLTSETNVWSESYVRAAVVASGAHAAVAVYPMTGAEAKQRLVRNAITLAEDLGRAIREARAAHTSPVEAVLAKQRGVLLFTGKVEEVERRNEGGWTVGKAHMSGLDDDRGHRMTVHFQNEHLAAERDGRVIATTPDLIMTMEIDSGEPIPAEEIRYGYRVAVVGLPCDPHWRTEAGIRIAGPRHFGYDLDYRPVEEMSR